LQKNCRDFCGQNRPSPDEAGGRAVHIILLNCFQKSALREIFKLFLNFFPIRLFNSYNFLKDRETCALLSVVYQGMEWCASPIKFTPGEGRIFRPGEMKSEVESKSGKT
jgi:hypothetical protein